MNEKLGISKKIGDFGENVVYNYLISKGFNFITKNFRCKYGEIDIIFENDEYILFVEVKTRHENFIVGGAEAVNFQKQQKIIKSAMVFMQNRLDLKQPRFDVAEVLIDFRQNVKKLNYIENAFEAEFEKIDEFI